MNTRPFCCAFLILGVLLVLDSGGEEIVGVIESHATKTIPPATEVEIPTSNGDMRGLRFNFEATISSQRPQPINLLYIPKTGRAWTGNQFEGIQAVVEDRFMGFEYWAGQGNEQLRLSVSTNRYEPNIKDVSLVVRTELELYKAGRGRGGLPEYVVQLEPLLGSAVLRNSRGPKIDGWWDTNAFSLVTRPSRFAGVSVEGTNVVAAIEFGTNMLAKIAFDKNVRPVWATTNGVYIGAIPTNTVHYLEDMPGGKIKESVVY